MNKIASLVVLVFLAVNSLPVCAQPPAGNHDRVYGYDPLLYNGRIYSFFPEPGTEGTQFIADQFDTNGKVILRGVTYRNLTLNYDLYNQKLVLKYKNAIGSTSLIEISEAWLESFELSGCKFENIAASDTIKRFYKVLGTGPAKILYYYRKDLLIDTRTASKKHYFSEAHTDKYVKTGNKLLKFNNNKSFVAIFGPGANELIQKYLRKQKIKVRKANDNKMTELINYCNSLKAL